MMKELNKEQEALAVDILICVMMVSIGLCLWYHCYSTLWVWALWMIGVVVVKFRNGVNGMEKNNDR
jgi:hypothetical protein